MCEILESKIGCKSFNVQEYVKLCALDNIAETSMGVAINAQKNPTIEFASAIKRMCFIVFLRSLRPWYSFDFIFNLSKYSKEQVNLLEILHGFTRNVIYQRLEQRKVKQITGESPSNLDDMGIKIKKAFLDILLDSYDVGSLTLDEVQEEVDTFMFEGHDTITSALSFTIFNLANYSEIQKKVYNELKEIFGDDDRLPNMEDLNQMKYLEMVIKETLRLQSSVPTFGRYIEKDIKLDDYSTIPAGIDIMLLSPGIHRNPDVWDKPNIFDPDRFLPENSLNRHPYAFVPFSAGPRNCIGMKFAMYEMKSSVSKILRKFLLKPSDPVETIKYGPEVVLVSHNGVPISLELRNT